MSSETLLDIILSELLPEEHKTNIPKIGNGFKRQSRVCRESRVSGLFPRAFWTVWTAGSLWLETAAFSSLWRREGL